LLLNVPADFTEVDILSEDEIKVCPHHIIFDLDADAIADPALEKAVDPAWNLCKAADARDTQS
jgi:hypothetical protein